ncbi:MAG: TAXI family TRAP transporter solute-binding subunit [Burkholderiaceae bacterium]
MTQAFTKGLLALAAGAALSAAVPAVAQDIFRFESVQPGSTLGTVSLGFVQAVEKHTKYKVQMSSGKPVTKSVLTGAQGDIDLFATSPGILDSMKRGEDMYKKVKGAPELAKNVRGLFNFPLGMYHYLVWDESGIKTLEDLKGKKLFLGPPGGQAPAVSSALIEAVTGLKAKADYELMRFDWTSGRTAFSDRQMDLTGIPTSVPSTLIEEFGSSSPLRILGIPKNRIEEPAIKEILNRPGFSLGTIDPAAYGDKVVNKEPVYTMAAWIGLATNNKVPEEVIYEMTKAVWENVKDIHDMAAWGSRTVTKENALIQMNIPLHAGAYRYYKESGFTVPDSLRPPEAK